MIPRSTNPQHPESSSSAGKHGLEMPEMVESDFLKPFVLTECLRLASFLQATEWTLHVPEGTRFSPEGLASLSERCNDTRLTGVVVCRSHYS